MNRRQVPVAFFFLLAAILLIFSLMDDNETPAYIKNAGLIHGTMYHVTYEHPKGTDLQEEIEQTMHLFDKSLSTYQSNSIISRINQNDETAQTDELFEQMYEKASAISKATNGAFDITVAPLVNLWGFGFAPSEVAQIPQQSAIDSILSYSGYQNIQLKNHQLIKNDPRIMLDANAIAKGYSVDIVAGFLSKQGIENYMVEIGGEIIVKGINPKKEAWRVGVDKPIDDPSAANREIQKVIALSDNALATSGNYRQYYVRDGKKYSHTINPRTGYPVEHNLLSATVIAKDCMSADAFATACMVMGVDKSMEIAEKLKGIEIYLIYENELGQMAETYTNGFAEYFD